MKYLKIICLLLFGFYQHANAVDVYKLQQTVNVLKLPDIKVAVVARGTQWTKVFEQQNLVNNIDANWKQYQISNHNEIWLKFKATNSSIRNMNLYLDLYRVEDVTAYKQRNKKLLYIGKSGWYVPTKQAVLKYDRLLLPLNCEPLSSNTIYLKISFRHVDPHKFKILLTNDPKTELNSFLGRIEETSITIFFLGAFSFFSLFMLFMYLKSRQNVYIYYSFYLWGAIIYSLSRIDNLTDLGAWILNFPMWRITFNEPGQFLFFAAYNWFTIALLDIKKQDKQLFKLLKNLALAYIVYALSYFLFNNFYISYAFRLKLFYLHRIVLFPLSIYLVILTIKRIKSPVKGYFLVGISLFLTSALFASIIVFLRPVTSFDFSALNIFHYGLMAEALCFGLALGYKIKLSEKEKQESQAQLILQLQKNKEITEEANMLLEKKVEERTQALTVANRKIAERKSKELQNNFEKQLAKAETMALRSQMNPHFLFNSLNSIKYLIQSKQDQLAITYLTKFSHLVRMVLEHSKTDVVPISSEMEALRLYLEIEANRLGEQFNYQISIDESLNTEINTMPPLLLQPFVENAIWHGLLNSEKASKWVEVKVSFDQKNHKCYFTIVDNGIGRQRSAELKSKAFAANRSIGMQLVKDRIELFNKSDKQLEISIEDVIKDGKVDGTKVTISLNYGKN